MAHPFAYSDALRLAEEWSETAPVGSKQVTIRIPSDMVQTAKTVGGARYGDVLRIWMRMGAILDLLLHQGNVTRFYVYALVPPVGRKAAGFHVGLESADEHRYYRPRAGGHIPASVEMYMSEQTLKVGGLASVISDISATAQAEVVSARRSDADSAFRFTVLVPRPIPVIVRVEAESLGAAGRLLTRINCHADELLHDLKTKGSPVRLDIAR